MGDSAIRLLGEFALAPVFHCRVERNPSIIFLDVARREKPTKTLHRRGRGGRREDVEKGKSWLVCFSDWNLCGPRPWPAPLCVLCGEGFWLRFWLRLDGGQALFSGHGGISAAAEDDVCGFWFLWPCAPGQERLRGLRLSGLLRHAEVEFQQVTLPGDQAPFLIPKQVTATIETDKEKIVITSVYEPKQPSLTKQ
jgi:hypothetical protein